MIKQFIRAFTFIFFIPLSLCAQTYFQQEVNYKIAVTLDDVKHELKADESIEYINNSPDQLTFIYMHLWPNAYKNNSTALAKHKLESGETELYYATENEKGFIDQLDFKVNGAVVKCENDPVHIDICKLILNEPIPSGGRITITTPFHVKLPSGKISRLGHIGQSYQITQWYPKPAVYDRNGWNPMPYLNQGEFYSEFGSYDVSITLPKNYVLGATGDLIGGEKEIDWLNENVRTTEATNFFNKEDQSFPPSLAEMKTLRFVQSKVHDFAWFCDKRYHVLKGEVETPHTKRKVTSWVMFTNAEAELWTKSIKYVNDAIYYYSLWNGDYPYNNVTAVDGTISAGGGMEYPNITVIGSAGNAFTLETVIMHEVGHNWFYGMLGSNERLHPWMDEGLNSFNENRYIETKYPEASIVGHRVIKQFDLARYKHKAQYEISYLINAKRNKDQPIEAPAPAYTQLNYGGIVYAKSAIAFDYLMAYLGKKTMDEAMQLYFETWKFKHPQPSDLRKILEQVSEKDLSWFFNDMIQTTKKLDYKIVSSKKLPDGSFDILVKNVGQINGPVQICGVRDGKMVGVIFYDGFEGQQLLGFPPSEVDYFKIDFNEDMPEVNRNNNTLKTKGLFKKVEPIKLQFLGSLDNPDRSQLFFTPVVGWNNYNKHMLGLAFYNNLFPQKNFEFQLMPMYSTGTKDLAGSGRIAYNYCPKGKLFQQITISATASRYCYSTGPHPYNLNFNKLSPMLEFEFKKKDPRSTIKHIVTERFVYILQDNVIPKIDFAPYIYVPVTDTLAVNDLSYKFSNERVINPFSAKINFQSAKDFSKLSLEGNYQLTFKGTKKGLDLRLFAGKFLSGSSYSFKTSGPTGYQDYLFDNVFLGRSEAFGKGVLSQQFTETDGGMKAYTAYGRSTDWLLTLNMKCSLPVVPISLFADAGTYAEAKDELKNSVLLYDAGLCLVVSKDIFEIYFPLLVSNDIQDNYDANGVKFIEKIRFKLNINMINPFKLIKDFAL